MEKVSLPIKTKIAAWWMIMIGVIISIEGVITINERITSMAVGAPIDLGGIVDEIIFWGLSSLFFFLPALFLFKRKKWAWYLAAGTTAIVSLFIFEWYLPFKFIILLPFFTLAPLILLLLDRKNFWKTTLKPTEISVLIEKLPFPIKTKIAAWSMIIFGSVEIVLLLMFTSAMRRSYFTLSEFVIWLFWLIWILIGVSILGREKWAWWVVIIFSTIGSIVLAFPWYLILSIVLTDPECFLRNCYVDPFGHVHSILWGLSVLSIPLIIPLILLLLDRKNFWKIAS